MSEKLYAFLLRLYPAPFRKAYGEDALQLLRDRLRDEPGFAGRLRLWIDLLADLAVSAPREHRRVAPTASLPAEARLFQVLEMEPPRPSTFFFGGALALAGLAAFIFLLSYAGVRKPFRSEASPASQVASTQPAGSSRSATQLGAEGQAQSSSNTSEDQRQTNRRAAEFLLDAAERQRVLAAVIANVREYEDDRAAAKHIVASLRSNQRSGRYDAITSGRAFANALNTQMEAASPATRVLIFYTNIPFTSISPASTTHPIDDHFAISIPVGTHSPRGRNPAAMRTRRA